MSYVRGDVLVTTWNMKWFPSGIPDLRNDEDAERKAIAGAGRVLSDAVKDDDLEYVSEATLRSFYGAHFRSCFRDWKKSQKITHPGSGRFPDATFDYILYRGFERIVSRKIYTGVPLSDHNLVALRLR